MNQIILQHGTTTDSGRNDELVVLVAGRLEEGPVSSRVSDFGGSIMSLEDLRSVRKEPMSIE